MLAVTAGALVGRALAADPALATLPVALTVVGTLLTTVPASQFMQRVGRRAGFALGALIGVASGLVCAAGIQTQSFALFAAGNLLIGAFQSFVGYFRFAAAESVPESFRSRAIAWVLAGGVARRPCSGRSSPHGARTSCQSARFWDPTSCWRCSAPR